MKYTLHFFSFLLLSTTCLFSADALIRAQTHQAWLAAFKQDKDLTLIQMIEREIPDDQYELASNLYKKHAKKMKQQRHTAQHLINLSPGCNYKCPAPIDASQLPAFYHLGYVAASDGPAEALKELNRKAKKSLFAVAFNLICPLLKSSAKQTVSTQTEPESSSSHSKKKRRVEKKDTTESKVFLS